MGQEQGQRGGFSCQQSRCTHSVTANATAPAGLLLVPAMLGITVSTTLSGRSIARTGRYKRFPVAGLALMTAALALLAVLAAEPSRLTTGVGLALFGLGFGMVTQELVVAVQNSVDRRQLGVATAATGFFRALGGAVGAAVLGAVFAAQTGSRASQAGAHGLGGALRGEIVDGVQAVFLIAAALAGLARWLHLEHRLQRPRSGPALRRVGRTDDAHNSKAEQHRKRPRWMRSGVPQARRRPRTCGASEPTGRLSGHGACG